MALSRHEANELLLRLLDNEISDADYEKLREWLDSSTDARGHYCRFMADYSALTLRSVSAVSSEEDQFTSEQYIDADFWSLMAEQEKNAPAMVISESQHEPERELISNVQRQPIVRTVNKAAVLVAAVSLFMFLVMVVFVQLAPPAPAEVATVVDAINARWSSDLSPSAGVRLSSPSKPIRLTEGVVELVTDENVKVVFEAPTEFRFVSYSEVSLSYGKLFAQVSDQGSGFSVVTPNSKLIDLGTEFGVVCDISGNTEVHMFKGKANLFAGQKSENKISEFLLAGSAKKVSYFDSAARDITLEEDLVIRNIDSRSGFVWRGQSVNLADIIGGGSGFGTGTLNRGLDPLTGKFTRRLSTTDVYHGKKQYVPVSSSPFVDGLFVPGAVDPPASVSSTGVETDAFKWDGTEKWLWGYICNGAWHEGADVFRHNLRIDGMELDGRKNPAIMMHSNLGVTFDLAAIRKELPGLSVKSLTAKFGISQTVNKWLSTRDFSNIDPTPGTIKLEKTRSSTAEVWVLVDGKKVFNGKASSASDALDINVQIDEGTRFLTLAVTEADDSHMFDWAAFVRPELNLELAAKAGK